MHIPAEIEQALSKFGIKFARKLLENVLIRLLLNFLKSRASLHGGLITRMQADIERRDQKEMYLAELFGSQRPRRRGEV